MDNNIYWSPIKDMQKRHIHLSIIQSSQKKATVRTLLSTLLFNNNNNHHKAIICQNVASSLTKLKDNLQSYMIENEVVGDVSIVEGKIQSELKSAITHYSFIYQQMCLC